MAEFDYAAAAELFALRRRLPRRDPFGYKRFEQAAEAIRFAIEQLPRECLAGAFLEVDEQRLRQRGYPAAVRKRKISARPSQCAIMTDKTIELDQHRGMYAQKATELRRLLADVEANERVLRLRQAELETHLLAAPAANWHEAAEKARYLLNLYAATLAAQDPRRQKLVAAVLADFARLSGES